MRIDPEVVVAHGCERYTVTCRPLGSQLRDLTEKADVVHFGSVIPGVLGILGYVLHHTRFRGQWEVTARPIDGGGAERVWRCGGRTQAVEKRRSLLAWLGAGGSLSAFGDG